MAILLIGLLMFVCSLGALIMSLVVFGCVYLLTLVLPLSQVQASIIFLSSFALLMLTFFAMIFIEELKGMGSKKLNKGGFLEDFFEGLDADEMGDWDDWDKEEFKEKKVHNKRGGRNKLCACGSGKIFKLCCFKQKDTPIQIIDAKRSKNKKSPQKSSKASPSKIH